MLILDNNTVQLEEGETIPVGCECGHIYKPESGSDHSVCPKCNRFVSHTNAAKWERVGDNESE